MNFTHPRRRLVLAGLCGLGATLLLQGCAAPPHHRAEREVVYVQAQPAPPPLRVETAPPPPGFDAYWVHGHWAWNGREYVWSNGHWTQARRDEVLVRASWELQDGRWVFHPERWVRARPPGGYVEVITQAPPPPPRVEVIPPPPSPGHFWVAGHWHWDGRRFDWRGGHWEQHRAGLVYVHPHWAQAGPNFKFVGGFWQ